MTKQPTKNPVFCSVEKQCGACQLLTTPYAEQLSNKQQQVKSLFSQFLQRGGKGLVKGVDTYPAKGPTKSTDKGGIIHPIKGMDDPYHYRNKVVSPYAPGKKIPSLVDKKDKQGKQAQGKEGKRSSERTRRSRKAHRQYEILCGMYAHRSHRIIPTETCLIENASAKRIILTIRDLMPSFRIDPYREDSGTGFLRHAIVRVGHTSGEILVTLVTNDRIFAGGKAFARELVNRHPEITTVVQNVNTRQTNVIFGEQENTLYGPGFILDSVCELSFRISSSSFYQVNATQTEVLYRCAIEMAGLTGKETLVDAYCGTGTVGLVAAQGIHPEQFAAHVIGIDSVPAAIKDARNNAKHNKVSNAKYLVGDAGEILTDFAQEGAKVDVVLMDPPRSGASEEFLQALVQLSPDRIVYISCNPVTQVRDVEVLVKQGYRLRSIQPVDMFPHTEHIETICLMSKDIRGNLASNV